MCMLMMITMILMLTLILMLSLSDVLIAVTDNSSQFNISDKMAEAGFTTNKQREFLRCFVYFVSFIYFCASSTVVQSELEILC